MSILKLAVIKFENLFLKTQICERCGRDLRGVPVEGFNEPGHRGLGERKVCPECGVILFL